MLRDGARARFSVGVQTADTGRLELEIRDENMRLPQGNMFPVLTHAQSGRTWRILRYARRYDGLVFRDLPAGTFTLRLASSRHLTVDTQISLEPGQCLRLSIQLEPRPERPRLVFAVGDVETAILHPGDHQASRLLASLLADNAVIDAMESPLERLAGIDACARHHARRLLTVGFPAPRRPLTQRMFWSIVDHRCRLEALLAATFVNDAVRSALNVDAEHVASEARRAVDGLDRLDIADALMLLAMRTAPWKAVMGEVCRAQAGIRDVLIPPGLANLLTPTANPVVPRRPFAPGRWHGGGPDATLLEAGPCAARLATLIARAADGQAAYGTLFVPSSNPRARPTDDLRKTSDHPDAARVLSMHGGLRELLLRVASRHRGKAAPATHARDDRAGRGDAVDAAGVFSGGECFMLEDELVIAVARCTEHGLGSRCVTNGYWATSPKAAHARLEPLYRAGLRELNLSTGDHHQQFVPVERIAYGAAAAIGLGMNAVVVVERQLYRGFDARALLAHPAMAAIRDHPGLIVFGSPWMPMEDRNSVQHGAAQPRQCG